jgi:hypothetical protein
MRVLTGSVFVYCMMSALSVVPALAQSTAPAPGPIPGAGLLSFVAVGLVGLGTAGLNRLRRNRDK